MAAGAGSVEPSVVGKVIEVVTYHLVAFNGTTRSADASLSSCCHRCIVIGKVILYIAGGSGRDNHWRRRLLRQGPCRET